MIHLTRPSIAIFSTLALTAAAMGQAAAPPATPIAPAAPVAAATATTPSAPAFAPPYPQRTNPFKQPDNKAALATRREAVVQQIDLRLKGFINVSGSTRAVVVLDGEVITLGDNEKRGDIQVLEIAPPTLTLQRGRYRWTESLLDAMTAKAVAQSR